MKSRIQVVFEDDWIIGIDKPSGLLSIPDRYDHSLPSASVLLDQMYGKVYTVHRLDKQTSGIMLFAKDADTHRELNRMFMQRELEKLYRVFVRGVPPEAEGVIDKPISYQEPGGKVQIHPSGKPSVTRFRLLEPFRAHSLVEAEILSGRTHQIRIHFPSAGMRLSVDELYGSGEGVYLSSFKKKFRASGRKKEERPLLDRLSLHASSIKFRHPATEENIVIHVPMPRDMSALLNQLRKWSSP